MKILVIPNPAILTDLTKEQRERIRHAAGEGSELVVAHTPEEQRAHAPGADVVLGYLSPEAFALAQRLKWVQVLSTGADRMLYPKFRGSSIPLVSNKGLTASQMADHVFALLLALTRGIAIGIRRPGRHDDQPVFRRTLRELEGTTMGIIGLGGTGVAVARRAAGFGMRVMATNPSPRPPMPFVARVWQPDRLHDLLAESDVVAICCPLTPATRGLLNLDTFEHMKPSAILINVTRGPIVEEGALLQALQGGLIAGAGLDATPREPLPSDSPLWRMENVIITPHTAGGSPHSANRSVARFCENLRRWRRGQPLEGLVDKAEGY